MNTASIEGKRICVVDDDDMYREFLKVLLGGLNADVSEARDSSELMDLLGRKTFDCILLDYNLKTESGLSIYAEIVSRMEHPPPVVMLSGTENQRTIIKAFRTGIADYVLKRSLQPDELLSAIQRAISRHQQERSSLDELARLKQRATIDDLTGLHSLASIQSRMEAIPPGRVFAVVLIAFNQFKMIAERFGSVAGDRALRLFAAQIRSLGRREDVYGRRGPDTFIYLIDTEQDPGPIAEIVSRLDKGLKFTMNLQNASLDVSATLGWAMRGRDGDSPAAVLAAADLALAEALKSRGDAQATEDTRQDVEDKPAPAGPMLRETDRRRERRQRVLKQARIVSADPYLSVTCTVRDQSSLGVRIRIESFFKIPDQFELVFVNSTLRKRVRKVWQNGREIGLEFLED